MLSIPKAISSDPRSGRHRAAAGVLPHEMFIEQICQFPALQAHRVECVALAEEAAA
jgi:hypothetical protein